MGSLQDVLKYVEENTPKTPKLLKKGGCVKKMIEGGDPTMMAAQAIKEKYDKIMGNVGMAAGTIGGLLTASELNPNSSPNKTTSIAADALKGVQAGAALGPLGMAGGAILGGVVGYGSYMQRKELQDAQDYMKDKAYIQNRTVDQNTGYYQEGGQVPEQEALPLMKYEKSYFVPPMPMAIKDVDPQSPYQHVQTERGEMVLMPDGGLVPVKATKLHKDMKKDEVTDILPAGSYVMSDFNKKKLKKDNMEKVILGHGAVEYEEGESDDPIKEVKMSDYMTKKEMTPAEISEEIVKKYTISSRKKDIFADITNERNRVNRMPFLAKLVEINESKKAKVEPIDTETFRMGGKVKTYQSGGGIINQTGFTPGKSTNSNPYNVIDTKGTGKITMKNTPFAIYAVPDKGEPRILLPGEEYQFMGANYITEIPIESNLLNQVDVSAKRDASIPVSTPKDLPEVVISASKPSLFKDNVEQKLTYDLMDKLLKKGNEKSAIKILNKLKKYQSDNVSTKNKGLDFSTGLSKEDVNKVKSSIDLSIDSTPPFKLQQGGPVIKPKYPIDIYKQLPKAVIPPYAKFPIEDPKGSGNYRYATEQEIEEINSYIQDSERENIKGESGYSYPTGEENNYKLDDIYKGGGPNGLFRTDDPYSGRSPREEENIREDNRKRAEIGGVTAEDEDFLDPDYYGPPTGGYRILERDNNSVSREDAADQFKEFPPKIDRLPGGINQKNIPIDISENLPPILPGVPHERDVRRSYNPPSDRIKKEKLQKPPKKAWIIPPGLPGMSPITIPFPPVNRFTKQVEIPKNQNPSNSGSSYSEAVPGQTVGQVPEQGYGIDSSPNDRVSIPSPIPGGPHFALPPIPINPDQVNLGTVKYPAIPKEEEPGPDGLTQHQRLQKQYLEFLDNYKQKFQSNSNYGRVASGAGHALGAIGSALQDATVDPTLKSTKYLRRAFQGVPQYLKDYQISQTQKPLDTLARNLGRAGYNGNQLQAILSGATARSQDATNRQMYQYNMNDLNQEMGYNKAMQGVEDFNSGSITQAGNEQRGLQNSKLARTLGYISQGLTRDASLKSKGLETAFGLDKEGFAFQQRQLDTKLQAEQMRQMLEKLYGNKSVI